MKLEAEDLQHTVLEPNRAWSCRTSKHGRNQFIYFERGLGYRRVFPPCEYAELERRWPDVFGSGPQTPFARAALPELNKQNEWPCPKCGYLWADTAPGSWFVKWCAGTGCPQCWPRTRAPRA